MGGTGRRGAYARVLAGPAVALVLWVVLFQVVMAVLREGVHGFAALVAVLVFMAGAVWVGLVGANGVARVRRLRPPLPEWVFDMPAEAGGLVRIDVHHEDRPAVADHLLLQHGAGLDHVVALPVSGRWQFTAVLSDGRRQAYDGSGRPLGGPTHPTAHETRGHHDEL